LIEDDPKLIAIGVHDEENIPNPILVASTRTSRWSRDPDGGAAFDTIGPSCRRVEGGIGPKADIHITVPYDGLRPRPG
jgi:hypothetical protein